MQTEYLVAFFAIFLIDSLSPGPAVATIVAKSAAIGLRRTMPFLLGLVLGDLALFVLAVGGLIALAAALGPLFVIVKWGGIAYLLWLAYKMWNAPPTRSESVQAKGEGWRLFAVGSLMPFGNPKAIGFYIALLPTVMDVAAIDATMGGAFALVVVVVWTSVLAGYGFAAERAARLLTSDKGQRWLNKCSALTLVGVAGSAAARQS